MASEKIRVSISSLCPGKPFYYDGDPRIPQWSGIPTHVGPFHQQRNYYGPWDSDDSSSWFHSDSEDEEPCNSLVFPDHAFHGVERQVLNITQPPEVNNINNTEVVMSISDPATSLVSESEHRTTPVERPIEISPRSPSPVSTIRTGHVFAGRDEAPSVYTQPGNILPDSPMSPLDRKMGAFYP